jgi:hypothetical protein
MCSVFYLLCSEWERHNELLSREADMKWGMLTINRKAVAHKETRPIHCPAKRQDEAMKTCKHIMMQSAVNSILRCIMCVLGRNRWTSHENRYLLNDLKPGSYIKSFLCLRHDMYDIMACQNSGTLQPHEHGCVMHNMRNIVDLTTTKN